MKIIRFLLLLLISIFVFSCSNISSKKKKNVLMIIVDDLRPEIASWGNKTVRTPNIDNLVQRGISFKRAYAQYANCSPSRISFLTGIRPERLGHTGNLNEKKDFLDHITLPGHFKNSGYFTASFGKVYHSIEDDKESWDLIYDVDRNNIGGIPWESYASKRNQMLNGFDRPAVESTIEPIENYNDYKISIAVEDALEENKEKPFFMVVGFRKPHLPFAAPKKYWDIYQREDIPLSKRMDAPANGDTIVYQWSELASYQHYKENYFSNNYRNSIIDSERARELRHGYLACISYIDDLVGSIVGKLIELDLDEKTIIVFMSDHGYHLGDQGIWGKHSSYELSTNVPLIIVDPLQKNKGGQCLNFVELIDIYPTLAELTFTVSPENIDGQSLYNMLNNPDQESAGYALSQYQTFQNNRPFSDYMAYAIYTKDFNYIEWQDLQNNRQVMQKELYKMGDIRIEKENISSKIEYSDIQKELSLKIWKEFGL